MLIGLKLKVGIKYKNWARPECELTKTMPKKAIRLMVNINENVQMYYVVNIMQVSEFKACVKKSRKNGINRFAYLAKIRGKQGWD